MNSKSADIVDLRVNFPLKISLTTFLLAAVLDLIFYATTSSLENTLIFAAATTAAAGTVLAAFYSARVLSLQLAQDIRSRHEYMQSIVLKKKENAMRFGARWTDPQMQKARETCREIANMKGHSLEQVQAALNSEEKQLDVFHLLNFFEEIAIAIEYDMADSDTLKEMYAEAVRSVWQSLHVWIEDYKDTHKLTEAWTNVQDLQKVWEK